MNTPLANRPDPLKTVQKLIKEKYPDAEAVFWSGSVSKGQGSETSDLDLVVIMDNVNNPAREAYYYDEWPMDVFIHDISTLDYFYHYRNLPNFSPALATMIAEGVVVTQGSKLAWKLQEQAADVLRGKPAISKGDLDNRRFQITDQLDDLKSAKSTFEFMAIKNSLFRYLAEFYLLANGQWIGMSKQLARLIENYDKSVADAFYKAFLTDEIDTIEQFIQKLLEPYGGMLWDGFRNDYPEHWRSNLE